MSVENMIFDLLAGDKELVTYRKSLRPIAKSVTATILLHQIIWHWRTRKGGTFYKFRSPCQHELYREGDSWTEELGFSAQEFDGALARIGTKITKGVKKNEILAGPETETNEEKVQRLVLYWTDADRVTWYHVNGDLLGKVLKAIYLEDEKTPFTYKDTKPDLPLTPETPTETSSESGIRVRENGSSQSETTTPSKSKERTVVAPYPALGELSNTGTAGQWADARGQAQAAAPGYVREMSLVRDALLAAHHIQLAALEDAALRSKWMKQTVRFWEAGLNSVAAVQALARRWASENPFGQKGQAPAGDQLLTFHFSGVQPSAPTAPDGTPAPAYRPVLVDEWSA